MIVACVGSWGPALAQQPSVGALVEYVSLGGVAEADSVVIAVADDRSMARGVTLLSDGEPARLAPESIHELRLAGGGTYRRVLRGFKDENGVVDSAWRLARVVLTGPASLYRLDLPTSEKVTIGRDRRPTTFFLDLGEGAPVELVQTFTAKADGSYRRNPAYVGVLNYLLGGACPGVAETLTKSKPPDYEEAELARIVSEYNACVGGASEFAEVQRGGGKLESLWLDGGGLRTPAAPSPELDRVALTLGARVAIRPRRAPKLSGEVGLEAYHSLSTEKGPLGTRDSCYAGPNATVLCEPVPLPNAPDPSLAVRGLRVPLVLSYVLAGEGRLVRLLVRGGASVNFDRSYGRELGLFVYLRGGLGLETDRLRLYGSVESDQTVNLALGVRLVGPARGR